MGIQNQKPTSITIQAGDAEAEAFLEQLSLGIGAAVNLEAAEAGPPPIERLMIERMPSGGWIISEADDPCCKPRLQAARSTRGELLSFLDDNLEDVPVALSAE